MTYSVTHTTPGGLCIRRAPADFGELPLAAHLVSPRRGFMHHGLYAGQGRVIHYAGLAGGGSVEEVSLERFSRGRMIYLCESARRFSAEEVIRRARSRLGESSYRVLSNNCEHFCEWSLRGDSVSAQVAGLRSRMLLRCVARLMDLRFALSETLRHGLRALPATTPAASHSGAAPRVCE